MITVKVIYNRADIPEWIAVKGKKVDEASQRLYLDKLIQNALENAGMKWYASGTMMVGENLERDHAFDCDLEEIMSAPTELEINAELAALDVIERGAIIIP